MKQKKLILSTFVIALIVAIVYLANSGVFYKQLEKEFDLSQSSPLCDLHVNSCLVKLSNGKTITLDMEKPIKANSDIIFNVTSDLDVKILQMTIRGVEMDMGLFATTLKKSSDGLFTGSLKLPACMSGKMLWQINIVDDANKIGASYKIIVR